MSISYAICVCNELRELKELLCFLNKVKRAQDEIIVLCDDNNTTEEVRKLSTHSRPFNRDFANHKNYLNSLCTGDYIFNIDADEIPQEVLIKTIQTLIKDSSHELIYIPRINICPGYTQAFLIKQKFSCNENGWINWPDYQGRVYKKGLQWEGVVHEKIAVKTKPTVLNASPHLALWHIKSVEKQEEQNALYDTLMSL
jgi:hypothetical protein